MSCKSRIRSWPEKRKEAEPHRCRDQLPKRLVMQSHGITLSFHREMADSSRELVGLASAHLLEKLGKGWPVFSCAFRLRPAGCGRHVNLPRVRAVHGIGETVS